MQQRFTKIITEVNNRIRKWLPEDMGEKWMVHVEGGSVAFGSAYHKWALSVPFMKKSGITFKDVYKHCQEGTMKELAKKAPLHSVVLNMVIRHLPNPLEAQKIRIPIIWKGDMESPVGKAMLSVDENGPVGFMVTKIIVDPQAGWSIAPDVRQVRQALETAGGDTARAWLPSTLLATVRQMTA